MHDYVVVLLTNESKDLILDLGGSASWVLGKETAKNINFCVCCRNEQREVLGDERERSEGRNQAFLVGKVSGVEFVERRNNRDRYLIKFAEYADVSIDDFRLGSTRNPVVLGNRESCRSRNLNLDELDFKPMPAPTKSYAAWNSVREDIQLVTAREGLSIAQAKEGLARHYDVPASAIQITITG